MSAISKYAERLSRRDSSLKDIYLFGKHHSDSQLAELVDCLLAHPDVVKRVFLGGTRLTDETGVKLARYLAASSTIEFLDLSHNQLGSATYLALAAALRVNSSLRGLHLHGNQAVDRTRLDAAFVEALRLNPDRPAESNWWLYSWVQNAFLQLRNVAEKSTPPSMLEFLLCVHLDTKTFFTKTH